MTEYAICFDFPETPDPWFAGLIADAFALVNHLDDAMKFDSETAAETALLNAYGDGTRPYGAVVEVGT